jgi:catechol 2,3-dioxygenase
MAMSWDASKSAIGSEVTSAGIRPPNYRLPASTHVGKVRLAVSDLDASIAFYSGVVGLRVVSREGNLARLGAQTTNQILLELEGVPGVRPILHGKRLGLYHSAFLLPSREDLSSFVQHLRQLRVPFAAGDHLVSEAIYLTDPDGLEVEVYADRPRELWHYSGSQLRMGTMAVDFDSLPQVAPDSWKGTRSGTTVGHMHFYVGDLEAASVFYHEGLGLDIMVQIPSALFTSAGGYHHHVGLNLWAAGSPVAGETDARLLSWELILPDEIDVSHALQSLRTNGFEEKTDADGRTMVTDPWGITVALVSKNQHQQGKP